MTVEQRIRADIETRIHSGEWRPGDRIPFEHQLVSTYGCSRATVSKALTTLARAGLIDRRRKAGSFVARPQAHSAVLEVPDLAQIIAGRGETYSWERRLQRMATPADGHHIPMPAILIEGLHSGDGQPFALERRLISLTSVPQAADADFSAEAPGTWLLHHIPWTVARHQIRAIAATRAQAAALAIPAKTACLELERETWRSGQSVTHVHQIFPGDRFHLMAEFQPGPHGR